MFVCGCILTMVGGARNWLNIVCYIDGAARHGANVPGKRNGATDSALVAAVGILLCVTWAVTE